MEFPVFNKGDLVLIDPSKRDYESDRNYFASVTTLIGIVNSTVEGTSISIATRIGNLSQSIINVLTPSEYASKIQPAVHSFVKELTFNPTIILYQRTSYDLQDLRIGELYDVLRVEEVVSSTYIADKEEFVVHTTYRVHLRGTNIFNTSRNQTSAEQNRPSFFEDTPIQIVVPITSLIYFSKFKTFADSEILEHKKEKLELYRKIIEEKTKLPLMFRDCAIGFFGEENVDLQIEGQNKNLIIKFPEITISNNKNQTHKILDLYVKLVMQQKNNLLTYAYGCRSTRTVSEAASNYVHSHLHSISGLPIFSDFCLGSSEFGQQLAVLAHDNPSTYTEEKFDILFCLLDSYVRYESLEGGPHIRIETIVTKTPTLPNIDTSTSKMDNLYKKFIMAEDSFGFNFINRNQYATIEVDRDSLETKLIPYCTDLVIKDNGQYYAETGAIMLSSERTRPVGSRVLNFKGEHIEYKIIPDEKQEKERGQKVPHPQITQWISQEISSKFNKFVYDKEKAQNNCITA